VTLSDNEKRLYWTIWLVLALVAAVWLSFRARPTPPLSNTVIVELDEALRSRFQKVEVERSGVDFFQVNLFLSDSLIAAVTRFPKEMTLAYAAKRGPLLLDKGEFSLVLRPKQKEVSVRILNRKKVEFDTVTLQLPH
jgi:hypothetical protein